MSAEKIIVTTRIGRSSRTFVWEPSAPASIGHPFRWILEKTPSGVRVRDLQGTRGAVRKAEAVNVLDQAIQAGARVELANASISLRRIDPIPPAYATMSPEAGSANPSAQPHLYAFSGVRRALLDCSPVLSAYVAYAKSRPVFTLYRDPDGVRIKVLLRGTMLKFRGQPPKLGRPGDTWQLTREQLTTATVMRKWYWWRFNLATPQMPISGATDLRRGGEEGYFKTALLGMGVAFLALVGVLFLVPHAEEVPLPKKPEPPLVKILPRHRRDVPVPAPQAEAESDNGQTGAPAPAPVVEKAPEPPAAAPAPTLKKTETPVKAPKAEAKPAPKPPKTKPAAAKAPEVTAAQRAAESARVLRESLSGAMALAGKAAPAAPTARGATESRSLFAASDNKGVGAGDIKTSFKGNGVNIGSIGGKGIGGKNGKAGAGIGYGESGSLGGAEAGGSFVSTDTSGGTVNEGLSMDEVGTVISKHMAEVRYCHEAALVVNPRVEGKLLMDFEISGDGRVKKAAPRTSTLNNRTLEECIRARLATWHFPKTRGGVTVPVSFPFIFKVLEKN